MNGSADAQWRWNKLFPESKRKVVSMSIVDGGGNLRISVSNLGLDNNSVRLSFFHSGNIEAERVNADAFMKKLKGVWVVDVVGGEESIPLGGNHAES